MSLISRSFQFKLLIFWTYCPQNGKTLSVLILIIIYELRNKVEQGRDRRLVSLMCASFLCIPSH